MRGRKSAGKTLANGAETQVLGEDGTGAGGERPARRRCRGGTASVSSLPAAPPSLSIRGLSLAFGGLKALSDVSFDVPAGAITAVIGPNGAGKTSLFNCISGFYRP